MGWFANWRHERRKKKELGAINHLRRVLDNERSLDDALLKVIENIEIALSIGNQEKAEKLMPELIRMMLTKKIESKLEDSDFKKFKRTILKDLKFELQKVK